MSSLNYWDMHGAYQSFISWCQPLLLFDIAIDTWADEWPMARQPLHFTYALKHSNRSLCHRRLRHRVHLPTPGHDPLRVKRPVSVAVLNCIGTGPPLGPIHLVALDNRGCRQTHPFTIIYLAWFLAFSWMIPLSFHEVSTPSIFLSILQSPSTHFCIHQSASLHSSLWNITLY